jgi:hypothetical protein
VPETTLPDRTLPDRTLLSQLLDRQEITAVMAEYARWADLNGPDTATSRSAVIAWHRRWAARPAPRPDRH